MRPPACNQQAVKTATTNNPSAGPPLVLGNHPILCWIGELIGSVVRRVMP